MTEEGKKVWKELENMGWSNEPKDLHLEYFEDIVKATKKALTMPVVLDKSEELLAFAKHLLPKEELSLLMNEVSVFINESK
jgi:hypothetical protein